MLRSASDKDIEAELSYAYLHAVASRVGASCQVATRLADNRGVDAHLTAWGPFPKGGDRQEVDLKVQLKATIQQPTDLGTHLSFSLDDLGRYDELRNPNIGAVPRILVVLYLPTSNSEWLISSEQELTIRRSAYWVSLVGAKESKNKSSVTVYLPKAQRLTPDSLKGLFGDISRGEIPQYSDPKETA